MRRLLVIGQVHEPSTYDPQAVKVAREQKAQRERATLLAMVRRG